MKQTSYKYLIFITLIVLILMLFYLIKVKNAQKELELKLSDVQTELNQSNSNLEDYKSLWEATKLFQNGNEVEAKLILERFENSKDTSFIKDITFLFKQNTIKPSSGYSKVVILDNTDEFEAEISEKEALISKTQEELSDAQKRLSALEKKQTKKGIITKDTLSLVSSKGVKFQYFGEIVKGKAHGYGVGVFETGSIYKGYWNQNSRHGKGTFTWEDGEYYDGDFISDKRQGKGVYHWTNGEKFDGEWSNDQRNGYGVLYKSNGKVKMEGNWIDDKLKKK